MEEKTTLIGGKPVTADHREIDPVTGMQKDYVVLAPEERAKGFVRPYRDTYKHVGNGGPKGKTRELTPEEKGQYQSYGYVLHEDYGPEKDPLVGKYWTQAELDGANAPCGGAVTKMGWELSETYARNPKFYSGTFCVGCKKHFPVAEFRWVADGFVVGS